ncbi:MAG: hypothetical protein ACE5J0_01715 [Candidatus Paceibacterales bacterium]
MLRKLGLYKKAIALRNRGLSYNEILNHIPVGQGTISRWCREITLTKKQRERLVDKKRNTPLIRSLREQAAKSKKEAKVWAIEQTSKLLKGDRDKLLLVSGILLYWAEGSKREKRVGFTNTDPKMIKIIMEFFRKILKVPENRFRIMVRIGDKKKLEIAEKYWSRITGVPRKNFQRSEILRLTPSSKSLERNPYGICRINVFDVSLSRKLIAVIEGFSKEFCPRSSTG